ncbi:MAG: hypothetical protein C0417_06470 [Chlorobiaceae bacterium]|nr:hypothetical protein [Chlorobiaceae bacterium]
MPLIRSDCLYLKSWIVPQKNVFVKENKKATTAITASYQYGLQAAIKDLYDRACPLFLSYYQ